jgi:hypothetical protein
MGELRLPSLLFRFGFGRFSQPYARPSAVFIDELDALTGQKVMILAEIGFVLSKLTLRSEPPSARYQPGRLIGEVLANGITPLGRDQNWVRSAKKAIGG